MLAFEYIFFPPVCMCSFFISGFEFLLGAGAKATTGLSLPVKLCRGGRKRQKMTGWKCAPSWGAQWHKLPVRIYQGTSQVQAQVQGCPVQGHCSGGQAQGTHRAWELAWRPVRVDQAGMLWLHFTRGFEAENVIWFWFNVLPLAVLGRIEWDKAAREGFVGGRENNGQIQIYI